MSELGTYDNYQVVYNPLPFFKLKVTSVKSIIDVPSTITCLNGGDSIPIMVKLDANPYSNLTVSLLLTPKNSVGLNLTSDSKVTLTPGVPQGVLKFKCQKDKAETGGQILYQISGDDASNYQLKNKQVKVTVSAANILDSGYPSLIYSLSSTPTKFVITATCPTIGTMLVLKAGIDATHPELTTAMATYKKW